ncbi:hypothetical protein [Reticulibacter mediterranei]|nr:hypothetical protein [Reticulibacter mediterranei]
MTGKIASVQNRDAILTTGATWFRPANGMLEAPDITLACLERD